MVSIEEKDLANLKKHLSNATLNKNSLAIASTVVNSLLENERANESLLTELGVIIDAAYQIHVAANTKAIIKLVTGYSGFISILLNASLYVSQTEAPKLEKALKADMIAMLDENAFVHLQKFYNKVNKDELSNWIRVLSLNTGRFTSASGLNNGDSKHIILCSSIVESLLHPLITTKNISEFFKNVQNKDFAYYAIVHGSFARLYVSSVAELEKVRFDRMKIVLDYIVKDLENVDLNGPLLQELLWLAGSEKLNSNLKLITLLEKRLSKNPELKGKVLTAIRTNYNTIKNFFISKDGIFAQVRYFSQFLSSFLLK